MPGAAVNDFTRLQPTGRTGDCPPMRQWYRGAEEVGSAGPRGYLPVRPCAISSLRSRAWATSDIGRRVSMAVF